MTSSPAVSGETTPIQPDPDRIRSMFASIARRYDRANTVLSAGIHHRWRRDTVRWSGAQPGDRVLDCATGTGDLAVEFCKAVSEAGEVIGTDFTPEMIDLARRKTPLIRFEVADVTALPFPDNAFEISSIAFGIRNVADRARAIAELARVVRSGGRVMVLEFGQPPNPAFRFLYDLYRIHVLPRLGGLVTGDQGAYQYLERSAGRFPCGDEFVRLMKDNAAFTSIEFRRLSFGIAYLYRAVKA